MGSVGGCYGNAMIESFWSRMQIELLDQHRWRTRIELANAIFEYMDVWHYRQRRHGSIGMLTPIQFENTPPWHESKQCDSTDPGADTASTKPGPVQKAALHAHAAQVKTQASPPTT